MSDDLPPVRCDDPSTWQHRHEKIDLPRLLQLIEDNGGPINLDLHGCHMRGIDAGPEALRPHVDAYAQKHGTDASPPWLWPSGGINLDGAHLENADLQRAHLENADLHRAHLENARLDGAHLCAAELRQARLEGACLRHADLTAARLYGARLIGARVTGANLEAAHCRAAHLEGARLRGAQLQRAQLQYAYLEDADLQFARAEDARFHSARLKNANLRSVDLRQASLWFADLSRTMWHGCYLDRTGFAREQLGPATGDELAARGQGRVPARTPRATFRRAREAYLALKTNFNSIGRYDDASWAYVKEQQMEKAMHFPTTAGHRWIRERMGGAVPPPWWGPGRLPRWVWWKLRSAFYHTCLFVGFCPHEVKQKIARRTEEGRERDEWLSRWRWARNWSYELLSGYGEWPHMPVIWAAVVVLLFAIIYAAAGNIATGDVGALEGQPTHSPITALVHSISAFATIGFNTLEPQGWGARLLTALEAMFGIGLFALFVFTLGNRMRRS